MSARKNFLLSKGYGALDLVFEGPNDVAIRISGIFLNRNSLKLGSPTQVSCLATALDVLTNFIIDRQNAYVWQIHHLRVVLSNNSSGQRKNGTRNSFLRKVTLLDSSSLVRSEINGKSS